MADEAFKAMASLTSCLAPVLQPFSADVATALCMIATSPSGVAHELRIVSGVENNGESERSSSGAVEKVLKGLLEACKLGPLPAASFWAVYPVRKEKIIKNGDRKKSAFFF